MTTVATTLGRLTSSTQSSSSPFQSLMMDSGYVGVMEEDFSPEAEKEEETRESTTIKSSIGPIHNDNHTTSINNKSNDNTPSQRQSHRRNSTSVSKPHSADSMTESAGGSSIRLNQAKINAASDQHHATNVDNSIASIPRSNDNGWPASIPIVVSDPSKVHVFHLDRGSSSLAQALRKLRSTAAGKSIIINPLVVIDHQGERFVTWKSLMRFLLLSKTKKEKEAVQRKWIKSVADYKAAPGPNEDANAFDTHTITLLQGSESADHHLPERWCKGTQKVFNEDCVVSFIHEMNEWLAQEKHREILHIAVKYINEIRIRVFEGELNQHEETEIETGEHQSDSDHANLPTTVDLGEECTDTEMRHASNDSPVKDVIVSESASANLLGGSHPSATIGDPEPAAAGSSAADDVALNESFVNRSSPPNQPSSTVNMYSVLPGHASVSTMNDSDFLSHAIKCQQLHSQLGVELSYILMEYQRRAQQTSRAPR